MYNKQDVKVLILCGGKGTRLGNEATYIPKGMVKLGHKPIVWHVMKRYALYGFNDFILALGSKGEMIKDYFTRYEHYTNDIQVQLGKGVVKELTAHQESGWKVTLVDTGVLAMSGARIQRCKQYLTGDTFMVTYSDSIADVDIKKLLDFHRKSKKIVTVSGIIPPFRALEFEVKNNVAIGFYDVKKKEPGSSERYINGGYMLCNRDIFSYLSSFNECRLETEVFLKLIKDRQLAIYPHHGFWRWLDTDRDYEYLNELVDKNKMYWLYG